MNNNICTSIEQSERLVELGLDPMTRDMVYFDGVLCIERTFVPLDSRCIPAWSLAQLQLIMPERCFHELLRFNYTDGVLWLSRLTVDGKTYNEAAASPVTAVFKTFCHILQNGLLKGENK